MINELHLINSNEKGALTDMQNMQRVFCQEWCDEVRDEVKKLIAHYIDDEIKDLSKDSYFKIAEGKNEARDQFIFQFYYNEETRTVYLYYELDTILKHNYDPIEIYHRINNRLENNFQRETNRRIRILGPFLPGTTVKDPSYKSSVYPITMNTFTYWKCFDGVYRFISDPVYTNLLQSTLKFEQISEFVSKILEINKKYNFTKSDANNVNVESAFAELQNAYKSLGIEGKSLKPIEDNEVIIAYLDPFYPEVEEKMK